MEQFLHSAGIFISLNPMLTAQQLGIVILSDQHTFVDGNCKKLFDDAKKRHETTMIERFRTRMQFVFQAIITRHWGEFVYNIPELLHCQNFSFRIGFRDATAIVPSQNFRFKWFAFIADKESKRDKIYSLKEHRIRIENCMKVWRESGLGVEKYGAKDWFWNKRIDQDRTACFVGMYVKPKNSLCNNSSFIEFL